MSEWTIDKSRDVYNITAWGDGFFNIDTDGDVTAYPNGHNTAGVKFSRLIEGIEKAGLSLPVLVRFTDILSARLKSLSASFHRAIEEYDYHGPFTPVYPIKVNQQRSVIQELIESGGKQFGLEAGSKPELLAVIALLQGKGSIIVCNGYKDREFIRLALIGQKLGHEVYIILEKMSELSLVLEEAEKIGVMPKLGLRARLSTISAGKWQDTGGPKSKFGFSVAQILQVVDTLKQKNKLDTLQVLHFHLGSQIANIMDIQRGISECARFYVELHRLQVPIHTVDVGGGLGVDYEGSHSRSTYSKNYSIQEYANNIVYTLKDICDKNNLPHPQIITESGRALTAHHAVLITNIIDVESAFSAESINPPQKDDKPIIHDLWFGYENSTSRNALELYHDACHLMNESNTMYIHGILSINERAHAEQLYLATLTKIQPLLKHSVRSHREVLDELNEKLADKYFCNFSLFQSLPDIWAIDQIFPIMPLSGLDQQPIKRALVQDITCDSDGKIEYYVDSQGIETSLPLIPFDKKNPYLLGVFLVGAYQEILGDMHNLFGDTDSIHVEIQRDGSYQLVRPQKGDKVEDVLKYVGFDAKDLLQSYRNQTAKAALSTEESQLYIQELMSGLVGYTYLED